MARSGSRWDRSQTWLFWGSVLAFVIWTGFTTNGALAGLDQATGAPWLDPRSPAGQIGEAFALITNPFLIFTVIAGMAGWALQRRMRRLAAALASSCLAFPITLLLKWSTDQDRPDSPFADSLSYTWSSGYPAGHLVGVTILSWMLVTLAHAGRKPGASLPRAYFVAVGLDLAVLANQWALREQSLTQLVGGVLLGLAVASGALAFSGLAEIERAWAGLGLPHEQVLMRAAIIYNPTKIVDFPLFRRRVEFALQRQGWKPPLWLETTADDSGRGMATDAVAAEVDLVLVAGGDGTVREVCAALAHSGIPIGLIPAGTGNLLARNLAVPLDESAAIHLALTGTSRPIDLIHTETDQGSASFAVMSGIGLDAEIMNSTSPELKKMVKSGAYVVAAAQQLGGTGYELELSLDQQPPQRLEVVMALIGNVGSLQGGINLLPQASPSDGEFDVLLVSTGNAVDWARMLTGVMLGMQVDGLTYRRAKRLQITSATPARFQYDGDAAGETRNFTARIDPGAVLIVQPEAAAG